MMEMMLASQTLELQSGLQQKTIYLSGAGFTQVLDGENYSFRIDLSADSYDVQELAALTSTVSPGSELLLKLSGIPILSTVIEGPVRDGILEFHCLYPNAHQLLTQENLWILDWLNAVFSTTNVSSL